ncbi:MAG: type II toxin-antitoxin system Phd/YefM family antitoxin [Elusimicrobia bacterium]|nr:type II toxin-antitoxin system Phd/YefM family antitoxin [Candidatus Liberimonas magnetica]
MITVKENTTLVGVSELRDNLDKILNKTRESLVIIEKSHKPVVVLMSNKEYNKMTKMVKIAEDIILGVIAKERLLNSKNEDFVDIEKLI